MICFNIFLKQQQPSVFLGFMLLLLCAVFSCKHEGEEQEVVDPPVNLLDSIYGEHSEGVCYYYRKQLSTGAETFDTTYDSVIEIERVDSNSIRASGCAAPSFFPWHLPIGSTDTLFTYSAYVGSDHYTMEINLSDRTITTYHFHSATPSAPWFEQHDGKWKF